MESPHRSKLRLAENASVFLAFGTVAFLALGSSALRPEWLKDHRPGNSKTHDLKRQHAEFAQFDQAQQAAMQTEAETEKRLALLQTAAEHVAPDEYPAAVHSALNWPTREREAFLSAIARRWAAKDAQAACVFFAALEDPGLRIVATGAALETWASTAAEDALSWLRTQPEGDLRTALLERLIRLTQDHDPAVALAALNLLPEKPSDRDRRRELALRLASIDPRAAALAILKADSLTQSDRRALRKIAEGCVQADYSETSAWLKTLERNKATELRYAIGHAWGGVNPQAALQWTKQFDEGWRPYLASCAVAGWAEKDPVSARAYVAALPPGFERELLMGTLIHTLGVERKDIAAIVSLSRERTPAGDGNLRDQLTDLMRDGTFDHRTVAEALRALPQEDRNRELLDSFLASWAEKNPAEAADYMGANGLAAKNPQAAAAVTKALAGLNPEQAIGWAMQLPGGEARENAVATALRQLAATDAVRAWSLCEANLPPARQREVATSVAGALEKLPHSVGNETRRQDLARRLAERDIPAAMAALLRGWQDYEGTRRAATDLAALWLDHDPAAAMAWAAQLRNPEERQAFEQHLASAWARKDIQAVLQWVNGQPAENRSLLLSGVMEQWTKQDPSAAKEYALAMPNVEDRSAAIFNVACRLALDHNDFAGALELHKQLGSLEENRRAQLFRDLIGHANRDYREGAEILRNLPPSEENQRLLDRYIARWVWSDEAAAGQFLKENNLADKFPEAAGSYVSHLFFASHSADAAVAWARELPPGVARDRALSGAAQGLASQNPELAANLVLREIPAAFQPETASVVADRWFGKDPAHATAWAQSLTSEPNRTLACAAIVESWSSKDPTGPVVQWIESLPPGPTYDVAVAKYAKSVIATDPEAALSWISTIADPQLRQLQLENHTRLWLQNNRKDAIQWIQQTDSLSPATKQRLLSDDTH